MMKRNEDARLQRDGSPLTVGRKCMKSMQRRLFAHRVALLTFHTAPFARTLPCAHSLSRWFFYSLICLLSCSKVYLRNENVSIYSRNNPKYIMDVGSILGVTTPGLSHSFHSCWQALVQHFQVRWHDLFQD